MEKSKYRGFSIEIEQDEFPTSPREWSNLGKMVCYHRDYDLGDKHSFDKEDFLNGDNLMDGFEKGLRANGINPVIILPLYLYDHSGISMSTRHSYPYNDRWDSGCVGFIYADRDTILKEYSVKRITKKVIEKATAVLVSEVKTYSEYIEGDVWCYSVEDSEGEVIASCGGYFGSDSKYMMECAEGEVDAEISSRRKEHFKKLAQWVRNRVPLDKREPCPSFA